VKDDAVLGAEGNMDGRDIDYFGRTKPKYSMISKRAEVHFVERSILMQSAGFLRSTKVLNVRIGGRLSCLVRAPRLNTSLPLALAGSLGWRAVGGRVVVYARRDEKLGGSGSSGARGSIATIEAQRGAPRPAIDSERVSHPCPAIVPANF
jgi:hypothetical protein